MKKVRFTLALLAVVLAGGAVYAHNSKSMVINYYYDTIAGENCAAFAYTGTVCSGTQIQCTKIVNNQTVYISVEDTSLPVSDPDRCKILLAPRP